MVEVVNAAVLLTLAEADEATKVVDAAGAEELTYATEEEATRLAEEATSLAEETTWLAEEATWLAEVAGAWI